MEIYRRIADLQVSDAIVSLIKPIFIPDLFSKHKELKTEFSFLGSLDDYSQYYKDLEGSPWGKVAVKFPGPAEIPDIGLLRPLRKRHSLHSYWKNFRYQSERVEGEKELFLLLPLIINIPIDQFKVDKQIFQAIVNVYLFPFGSCVVNMDVTIPSCSFFNLINIVRNLRGSTILRTHTGAVADAVTFKKLSDDIVNQIVVSLFGSQRKIVSLNIVHTFVFIKKTNETLSNAFWPHKRAIKALMKKETLNEVVIQSEDFVNAYFEMKQKKLADGEVLSFEPQLVQKNVGETLLFKPEASFFCPDQAWKGDVDCMLNNYKSCLTFLFALNRFLKEYVSMQEIIPKERLDELKMAVSLAFPLDLSTVYFKHAYEQIAPAIGLCENLKDARAKWWT